MKHTRILPIAALAISTGMAALSLDIKPARAEGIKWDEYMQSAYLVGAIAAAMSVVEHCSKKPLLMQEIRTSADKRTLVFTCAGTEEEEASSILHIDKIGDGPWMPRSFSLAG